MGTLERRESVYLKTIESSETSQNLESPKTDEKLNVLFSKINLYN